ncbi:hypothetical protein [Paenibacillus sp. OAS669]|uniref:hypothetical protein n=1 Tax=Paenibacillus sp. OAS669 TaxID=2663821 RepID=UPI00178AC9E9|nr:hypothetical protein [Paenibacillus sp. OAS669]MBE1441031.1 hypothetical protein [Paenibacillus sp. OAS669]
MEPGQRTDREITYHVGWKRGKITQNHGTHPSEIVAEEHALVDSRLRSSGLLGWNMRYMWKKAGTVHERTLLIVLPVIPVLMFALSLWLVYRLAIHPY